MKGPTYLIDLMGGKLPCGGGLLYFQQSCAFEIASKTVAKRPFRVQWFVKHVIVLSHEKATCQNAANLSLQRPSPIPNVASLQFTTSRSHPHSPLSPETPSIVVRLRNHFISVATIFTQHPSHSSGYYQCVLFRALIELNCSVSHALSYLPSCRDALSHFTTQVIRRCIFVYGPSKWAPPGFLQKRTKLIWGRLLLCT